MTALTATAQRVLARRYLAPRPDGGVETPAELFARVAGAVAAVEARHGASPVEVAAVAARFEARMAALEFLPNSPTLMNAGRPLGQLAACFVLPVDDDLDAIFAALGWAAAIQKSGGGTGFAFSRLRPAGDPVGTTGGRAAGPVAFLRVFDAASAAVQQGGTRRGANMGVLRVDHPDVLAFVAAKLDGVGLSSFNLSVGLTDAFVAAVRADADYALVHPGTRAEVRRLPARRVWDAIVHAAWAVGDPGLVFLDRIDATQPTPALGAIEATNPCGEQPLLPFESCTLGSINLALLATPGVGDGVDWARLRAIIVDAVRFLDDVVDASRYPLPAIERATRATRKLGLGVMGLAELLSALRLPYGSDAAVALGERLATVLDHESRAASVALATERGAFPAWAGSRWQLAGHPPLRNATTTTVAPTGTISLIAGCTGGIEPRFALAFERHVLDGETLVELDAGFVAAASAAGVWSEAVHAHLVAHGSATGAPGVPAELAARFVTAHELPALAHVSMQAAFQRHVHAAVSKTINLPAEASPADVAAAYDLAWDLGCKGITVYRDRSRATQVLAVARGAAVPELEAGCPTCGAVLTRSGGCWLCVACGTSGCG